MARPRPQPTELDYRKERDWARGNPNDPDAAGVLAHALMGSKLNDWNGVTSNEVQEAERSAREAISRDLTNARAYYALGFIYRLKGEHIAALALFNEASNHDATNWYALAKAQAANEKVFLGHQQEAISDVDQLISNHGPDQSIDVFHWIKGRAHFSLGQYQNAINALGQIRPARLNDLWFTRAWLMAAYAKNGQVGMAQNMLQGFKNASPYKTPTLIGQYYQQPQYQNPTLQAASGRLVEGLGRLSW